MKKLFTVLFVLSFAIMPAVSHAGLFDFLRGDQGAQVKTSVTSNTVAAYKKGDRADVILEIQKALNARGLYAGDLSGLIGNKTEASIKAWQRSSGLPVTGLLDIHTINSILGRGSNNGRGSGGNRDGGFNGNFATNPPSLDYLQSRCGTNEEAFVRILSPWEGDQYVYEEDGAELKIFVCDATGTGNTHLIDGLVSQQIDIQNWSAIGPVQTVVTLDDTDMVAYGPNTWIATQILDEEEFEVGHHSLWISDEGGYKINNVPQYGANVYAGWTRPFEVVDELGGGGNCEEDDIELSVLPSTPFGVQMNTNDFPVLEFKVENPTNCNVRLDGMKFIYMVTDTLPYFEDLTLREKNTMLNVGTGEANTGISGEFLDLSFGQNGYIINAGDEQDFLLVLEVYNQPTQGQLPYNEFINKNMIFGLPKLNSLNFRFTTDMFPHVIQLPVNAWGKVVQLPL